MLYFLLICYKTKYFVTNITKIANALQNYIFLFGLVFVRTFVLLNFKKHIK